MTSIDHVYSS